MFSCRALYHVQLSEHCTVFSCQSTVQCSVVRALYTVQLSEHCTLFSCQSTVQCSVVRILYSVQLSDNLEGDVRAFQRRGITDSSSS